MEQSSSSYDDDDDDPTSLLHHALPHTHTHTDDQQNTPPTHNHHLQQLDDTQHTETAVHDDALYRHAPSKLPVATADYWGPELLGARKFLGGSFTHDEKALLGVPAHAERPLRLELDTGTVSFLGPPRRGKFKWLRAVRTADGAVYCIPANADCVLRISPTDEVTTLGRDVLPAGTWQWHGGAIGVDGCIYCIPANADRVLKIDPAGNGGAGAVELIGPVLYPGLNNKWYGGILSPDGRSIWGIPYGAPSALKIVPETGEVLEVGNFEMGGYKWHGGCTAGEYIIGVPSHATRVLRIKPGFGPIADELDLLGDEEHHGNYKWGGAATDGNGVVWTIPSNGDYLLRIVPETGDISVHGKEMLDNYKNKWQGAVIGCDGNVYCVPCDAMSVLVIDTKTAQLSLVGRLDAKKKKFQGGARAPDGSIYCLPESSERILRIVPASEARKLGAHGRGRSRRGKGEGPVGWLDQLLQDFRRCVLSGART